MKMRKYMVYMDDGFDGCFKAAVPAKSQKEALEFVQGNGEVVAIKDVTEDYHISESCVLDALRKSGFGSAEQMYIVRALYQIGICDVD